MFNPVSRGTSAKAKMERAIDSFRYKGDGKSRDARWDDQIPGLGVRIYPSGKKVFILSYRASGRKRLLKLGAYGVLTLDQARTKAKKFIGQVAEGIDPLLERNRERKGQTVKALTEAYIEKYAKLEKITWKTDQNRIDKYILPAFGRMLVKSLTKDDLENWHKKIGSAN
ncbi:integrase arm-type DNA-binding domain-containing protein [candidate division TA06 bacterium]|nr:integrase arm-type DNA-binding domain-containing protein [candidate division TA06 bacterium]